MTEEKPKRKRHRKGIRRNVGLRSIATSRKSKLYWKKIISFQADVADGFTYSELMSKYGIGSRQTVSRWKKLEVPEDMAKPGDVKEARKKLEEKKKKIFSEKDRNVSKIEFVEGKEYLNFKLFPMQKLILKAFYGLELTDEERATLIRLKEEGKTTWEEGVKYRELVLDVGMRGGKSVLAAAISLIEEKELWNKGNPVEHYGFPPGEEIFIINVATNRDQARDTIFAKTEGLIKNSEFYQKRNPNIIEREIEFPYGVKIRSGHANSDSLVGK